MDRVNWHLTTGKRIAFGAFVVTLCSSIGLFLVARHFKKAADPILTRANNSPMPVRTELVSQSTAEKIIGGTVLTIPSRSAKVRIRAGRGLQANGAANLVLPSTVIVKNVLVQMGDTVKKDQPLFEIDSSQYELALKQLEEALATAEQNLELVKEMNVVNQKLREKEKTASEADVEAIGATLDSRKKLLESAEEIYQKQANTVVDYYESRAEYQVAVSSKIAVDHKLERAIEALTTGPLQDKANLAEAIARRNVAQLAVSIARQNVELCKILSPIDGQIHHQEVVAGELVEMASVLAQVDTLDPMHIQMDFPQERIDELQLGQTAEIVLDSMPKEVFTGKVVKISTNVDTTTRVLGVIIEVKNPGMRIKTGIAGFARLRVSSQGLMVPATAVIQRGNKAIVFRVEEGLAKITPVQTGRLVEPGVLELRGGVDQGDEVVIFGNKDLNDNDRVNKDWRKWMLRE